jgi:hypothetical protein
LSEGRKSIWYVKLTSAYVRIGNPPPFSLLLKGLITPTKMIVTSKRKAFVSEKTLVMVIVNLS